MKIEYVIVRCARCGGELAIVPEFAGEDNICATCSRKHVRSEVNEDVVRIETAHEIVPSNNCE